ncbi:CLUMA_CG011725, isoform A [Clunio marinus]|uniref:CLUMA_CG011725, isoform A n=1 Tax=Clunio marinus TaxID=568069 RepID=A0A1J1IH52_9DIPT|nr:CLUMA_CG011725, isoform A [Clunio marinus]
MKSIQEYTILWNATENAEMHRYVSLTIPKPTSILHHFMTSSLLFLFESSCAALWQIRRDEDLSKEYKEKQMLLPVLWFRCNIKDNSKFAEKEM